MNGIIDFKNNTLFFDLRNAGIEHFSTEQEMTKSDITKCWNALNDMIARYSTAKQPKSTFIVDDCNIFDRFVIANEINVQWKIN